MSKNREKRQNCRKTIKNFKKKKRKTNKNIEKPSKISIKRKKTVKNVEKPVKSRQK